MSLSWDSLSESRVEEHLGFLLMYISWKIITAEGTWSHLPNLHFWVPAVHFQGCISKPKIPAACITQRDPASLKGSMCFFFTEPFIFSSMRWVSAKKNFGDLYLNSNKSPTYHIESMYGIFTYIYHENQPFMWVNTPFLMYGKSTIHVVFQAHKPGLLWLETSPTNGSVGVSYCYPPLSITSSKRVCACLLK